MSGSGILEEIEFRYNSWRAKKLEWDGIALVGDRNSELYDLFEDLVELNQDADLYASPEYLEDLEESELEAEMLERNGLTSQIVDVLNDTGIGENVAILASGGYRDVKEEVADVGPGVRYIRR